MQSSILIQQMGQIPTILMRMHIYWYISMEGDTYKTETNISLYRWAILMFIYAYSVDVICAWIIIIIIVYFCVSKVG